MRWNPLRQYWKRTNLYYIICIIAVFYPECLLHIGNPFSLFLYFPIDPQVRKSYSLRNATLSDAFTYLSCFPTGMKEAMFQTGETRERSGCHGEAMGKPTSRSPTADPVYPWATCSLLTLLLLTWLEIPAWQRLATVSPCIAAECVSVPQTQFS